MTKPQPEFAQVLLVDPTLEKTGEIRVDVADWHLGKRVKMRRDLLNPRRRSDLAHTPGGIPLTKHDPDPTTTWTVYPLMRPNHGDNPFDIRAERSGKWIAFKQGYLPRDLYEVINKLRIRLWIAVGIIGLFMLADLIRLIIAVY